MKRLGRPNGGGKKNEGISLFLVDLSINGNVDMRMVASIVQGT